MTESTPCPEPPRAESGPAGAGRPLLITVLILVSLMALLLLAGVLAPSAGAAGGCGGG